MRYKILYDRCLEDEVKKFIKVLIVESINCQNYATEVKDSTKKSPSMNLTPNFRPKGSAEKDKKKDQETGKNWSYPTSLEPHQARVNGTSWWKSIGSNMNQNPDHWYGSANTTWLWTDFTWCPMDYYWPKIRQVSLGPSSLEILVLNTSDILAVAAEKYSKSVDVIDHMTTTTKVKIARIHESITILTVAPDDADLEEDDGWI